jgi:anaerobic carbon-monoxide dehydrogenase iron sulfur subunit
LLLEESVQLRINDEKCTGCRICMTYCSFHHEGVIWPALARIRIETETDSGPFSPQACRQCNARRASEGALAPCAEACPVEAIRLDESTGAWVISLTECTGCGACEEACPFGMIIFDHQRELALKCDLCGGEPECAAMCPSGAIEVRLK